MTERTERGLCELYEADPERADALVWGRIAGPGRRGFLRGAGLATMTATLGMAIPYHRHMPSGLIPAALAQGLEDFRLEGKAPGLTVLNDRPVNMETPAHLLDDDITPADLHFVRNNGLIPEPPDPAEWRLIVEGEVDTPLELTLDELKNDFETVTYALQLECGGNGRSGFNPPASGNQWTVGAIGNSEWTGVRMADVLARAGLRDSAVYTGHYGFDPHLSGDPEKEAISRGIPIEKALEEHTLIAFAMNGQDIPLPHGYPVRVVAPGWPGSTSQKWLHRIWLRDRQHDGAKMTGQAYRVPAYPVAPGTEVPDADMVVIESMPVKSLITAPEAGFETPAGTPLEVRGHAWAGDRAVADVEVSTDFGATWTPAALDPPPNRYCWQRWRADVTLPQAGYYEVWSRAVDDAGGGQPMTVPGWNPRGYLNNVCHRIHVMAT